MALPVYIYPGNIVYITVHVLRVLASGLDHVFSLEVASLRVQRYFSNYEEKLCSILQKMIIYLEINFKKNKLTIEIGNYAEAESF